MLQCTSDMNKRITVQAHLSVEQVEARYRKAQDPVERSHWQIIWLVAQKKATGEIREVTGYSASWIYTIVHRYNREGPSGVGDRRHGNAGGIFILSAEQQQQLEHDLDAGAPDGGLWAGPKVAHWIFIHTGRQVHPQRGWEYLKRLGGSLRVLRPRHAKADPAAPSGFQKNLPEQLKALQQAHPESTLELWATDHHRIGLKPILRRIWVRRGSRPRVTVQQREHPLYVYSFVQPSSGQTEWYLLPSVTQRSSPLRFPSSLKRPAQVLPSACCSGQDQAGWHSSHELVVPEGIHLLFLPPYAPELQRMSNACGRSWAEGVANGMFRSLDDLEEAQVQRCIVLQNQPEVIRSHTFFHWWPPSDSKHQ